MKLKRKLPPYGSILAEQQKYSNLPDLVAICLGHGSWNSAKRRNSRDDGCAMVLPPDLKPESCIWPVARCRCLIEWNSGPDANLIVDLARCLLLAGAELVVIWPRFVDPKSPAFTYDDTKPLGDRWIQRREIIKIYHKPAGGNHVAA
ncbi:MAG: hypothetical protein PHY54_17930 [Methylococcales bacterium]|nr:hypothetical protein [Methylococcales bacterium]